MESPAQSYSEPDKPVDDKPISNKPESGKPIDNKLISNKPESGKPIDNKLISSKPESGKLVHDKPKSGKSVDDLHVNSQNGDKLFEISKLNGTVTEFSDDDFGNRTSNKPFYPIKNRLKACFGKPAEKKRHIR